MQPKRIYALISTGSLALILVACKQNPGPSAVSKPPPPTIDQQVTGQYSGIFNLTPEEAKDPGIQRLMVNMGNPKLQLKPDHTFIMKSQGTREGDWAVKGEVVTFTANGQGADPLKKDIFNFRIAPDRKSLRQIKKDGSDGNLVFKRK